MTTKVADSKGRIVLGSQFAGQMFIINDANPEHIVITPAVAIPASESWLYANEKALTLVRIGLQQAQDGQFSESPPDLDSDAVLTTEMEG